MIIRSDKGVPMRSLEDTLDWIENRGYSTGPLGILSAYSAGLITLSEYKALHYYVTHVVDED